MSTRRHVLSIAAGVMATVALAYTAIAQLTFGGEKVKFPDGYASGVLYTTVDRADNKQYRELYASADAVAAAKKGAPLPVGTVITLVQFKAKLDAAGVPEKDAKGRFIKGELVGYTVMEKQAGWGELIPTEIRNGDWLYQAFKADKSVNDKANLKNCFACHKPLDERLDFVFSYDKLAGK